MFAFLGICPLDLPQYLTSAILLGAFQEETKGTAGAAFETKRFCSIGFQRYSFLGNVLF